MADGTGGEDPRPFLEVLDETLVLVTEYCEEAAPAAASSSADDTDATLQEELKQIRFELQRAIWNVERQIRTTQQRQRNILPGMSRSTATPPAASHADLQIAYITQMVCDKIIPQAGGGGGTRQLAATTWANLQHSFRLSLRLLNSTKSIASTAMQLFWPGGTLNDIQQMNQVFQLPYILEKACVAPPSSSSPQPKKKRRRIAFSSAFSPLGAPTPHDGSDTLYCYVLCRLARDELKSTGLYGFTVAEWEQRVDGLAGRPFQYAASLAAAKALFLLDYSVEQTGKNLPEGLVLNLNSIAKELLRYGCPRVRACVLSGRELAPDVLLLLRNGWMVNPSTRLGSSLSVSVLRSTYPSLARSVLVCTAQRGEVYIWCNELRPLRHRDQLHGASWRCQQRRR